MPKQNGGTRLRRELKRRGLTYRSASRVLGAHFVKIHRVANGVNEPDLGLAAAIEREFGILVEEWPALRGPVEELLRLRGAA